MCKLNFNNSAKKMVDLRQSTLKFFITNGGQGEGMFFRFGVEFLFPGGDHQRPVPALVPSIVSQILFK